MTTKLDDTGRRIYAALRREARTPTPLDRGAAACLRIAREWLTRSDLARLAYPGKWEGESIWKAPRHVGIVGRAGARWVEQPESVGLRFFGLASDITRAAAEGWFCDLVEFATMRGVVYRLPARKGRTRYLAGTADPYNADSDGRGPVWLALGVYEAEHPGGGDGPAAWAAIDADEAARRDAALAADDMARRAAEDAREYEEGYLAGREAREKWREAAKARAAAMDVCRDVRALWRLRHGVQAIPAAVIRRHLVKHLGALRQARAAAREAREAAREARETWRAMRGHAAKGFSAGWAEGV